MVVCKYIKEFEIDGGRLMIMNTLSGAMDIIDKKIFTDIKEGIFQPENDEIYKRLKHRGYLIEDNEENYKALSKALSRQEKIKFATFIICTTYACNLGCSYCFESKDTKSNKYVLKREDIDLIFNAIEELKVTRGISKVCVLLYGGEPFLNITQDIVQYIFEKAFTFEYKMQAITNGTQLHLFKQLFRKYHDIIRQFQITLDGIEEVHNLTRKYLSGEGSFQDVVKNIDMCLELKIPIVVRINIGKKNIVSVRKLIEFIIQKSWNTYSNFFCQIAPVTDHYCTTLIDEWMPEHEHLRKIYGELREYFENPNQLNIRLGTDIEKRTARLKSVLIKNPNIADSILPCSSGLRNYFVFGTDGLIYACPETVGIKQYSIGTYKPKLVIEDEKERIWKRNVLNIEKCRDCSIAGICGGSCIWSSIATNGENFREPQCNYAQQTVDTFFELNKEKFIEMC